MARPPTKSGTPRLSELARHVVVPDGVAATGWPAVRDKCRDLGIGFDPWQDGAGRLILAKRADGIYAAGVGGVVISIPRQVGKTYLLGAIVFALCLLNPGLTVIWTAHRLRTASETFASMQSMARRKKIKPHVAKVVLGSGDEEIRFTNGSRILFGARERGFGRGFSEVDVIVFDEGQILTDNAIDDMVPAANQSPNPLLLFTGTPPKPTDPGEVFRRKRRRALSGESNNVVYIEFSADSGSDPMDRKQWPVANPSHPKRTPTEAMLRMIENLSAESIPREMLGIWDEDDSQLVMPNWPNCAIIGPPPPPTAIGVAVSVDRDWACIGASSTGKRPHLGAVLRAPGTDWVVAEVVRIQGEYGCAVVVDEGGPAANLIVDLERAGVAVTKVNTTKYKDACARLFDAVEVGAVEHTRYEELDQAVAAAKKRDIGDRWAWGRRTGDVSMLEAVTLAFYAANSDVASNVW